MTSQITDEIAKLQAEITVLQRKLDTEQLLTDIWHELGPYTGDLSRELRYRLQDHFNFDDSE